MEDNIFGENFCIVYLDGEHGSYFSYCDDNVDYLYKYFYSEQEIRKEKLKRLVFNQNVV